MIHFEYYICQRTPLVTADDESVYSAISEHDFLYVSNIIDLLKVTEGEQDPLKIHAEWFVEQFGHFHYYIYNFIRDMFDIGIF